MEHVFMQKHEPWLLIAQEDLASANHLHSKVLTTTLFHAQQCAEKSLKAYLVLKHDKLIKTHDLVQLVDLCIKFNKSFEEIRLLAAVLTPYETAGRYPDISFAKPSQEEMQSPIEQAKIILSFVLRQAKIGKGR